MPLLVDMALLIAAILTSPVWILQLWRKGKLRTDWPARLGWRTPKLGLPSASGKGPILIHAVSVGEVNAVRLLVERLAIECPDLSIVISSTTNTGIARAKALFEPRHTVVRFPFDLSWSMNRFLAAINPRCVLLAELELWPSFMRICGQRALPVVIVNGRFSQRSFKRCIKLKAFLSGMFRRVSHVCAQDSSYADRFAAMGVDRLRITVTGTMKWDTADVARRVEGTDELAQSLGIDRARKLVVAGSTAPEEVGLLRSACPQGVQLLCAPRKPEWFAQAIEDLPGCAVRTRSQGGSATGRFVLDTIGELRKAYSLADLVVVGRTFGQLHGSDMMEPAALGKAIVIGPRVGDFQATADALLDAKAVIQVPASDLGQVITALLADAGRLEDLGSRAREVVLANQGATARTCQVVKSVLAQEAAR